MDSLQMRLKSAREAAKLSQVELAKKVGISQPAYSGLEATPGAKSGHIVEIAAALGVNPQWLSLGTGPRYPYTSSSQENEEIAQLLEGIGPEDRPALLQVLRAMTRK